MKFDQLTLPQELIDHLTALGFTTMTPIQEKAIPAILDDRDIIAKAKTGSGKTLAFLVPLLTRLQTRQALPQALIIAPTRELCEQVATELKTLAKYKSHLKVISLYGGTSLTQQVASLEKGADVILGTPGRLLDHLFRQTLNLSRVHTLILDEADRMLDMGFYDDIEKVVAHLPQQRHSLLFSATYPEKIIRLSQRILYKPVQIEIGQETRPDIEEILYAVEEKKEALIHLLQSWKPKRVLIFCNTKAETNSLSDFLYAQEYDIATLSGELDQRARQEMLIHFSNGSLPVMVATDLAARGLDIEGIDLIINYDFPEKAITYTHRIGRTGRAESQGRAISLCHAHEMRYVKEMAPFAAIVDIHQLNIDKHFILQGDVATLCIEGGKSRNSAQET